MKNCRARLGHLAAIAILIIAAPAPSIVAQQSSGELKLASPIGDHMVLQHGKPTSVWGTASPDSTIKVEFGSQSLETKADKSGQWKVTLLASEISDEPSTLTVISDAGDTISVKDILVGEVWMCSGQSNMAWTMARCKDDASIKDANYPLMRIFTAAQATAETIQQDCGGQWKLVTPETAASFSAVGYHFGRELHESLKVPVGLVDTSWGGKPVEAFTSRKKLETVENAIPLLEEWDDIAAKYNADKAKANYQSALEKWKKRRDKLVAESAEDTKPKIPRKPQFQVKPERNPAFPASIYNQKVAPWTHYAIAGSIWYQGESNRNRAVQYESLLTAMIEDWREKWDDDFPFYIVQLANFQKASQRPGVEDSWAELQNSQLMVAQRVPNCGIAITNDIGAANDIHPRNKRDVGYRLALLALKKHYQQNIDVYSSPLYMSHSISDDHVLITMDHSGTGLKSRDGNKLNRFEIAGEDKKWHWATAEIQSADTIKVSSEFVSKPVAVRYAWAANPEGANLVNSAGLPASLFRTDDWPLSTRNNFTRRNKADVAKQMKRQGFSELFNGKNTSGWRNPFDYGKAEVVNGEIHLTANKKFFLVTEKEYDDFHLIAEIRLPKGTANSGIMFRCHVEPNRVYGYQAECDGSDRRWSAGLYDEGRRGWIWPSKQGRTKEKKFLEHAETSQAHFAKPEIRDALIRNGWNRYEVICQGDRIRIKLNGVLVTDLTDDEDAKGFIGIQHHGEKGQTYRFRNLYIKDLK